MQMAIEASLKEKQREDRRRTRGTRAEEEDQDRPMEECRDMAAVGETEGDKERDLDFDEPDCEPVLPFNKDDLMQQTSDSGTEPSSPIPVAGIASTSTQLKSVSLKKLSMKSLQTKKEKRIDAVAEKLSSSRKVVEAPASADQTMVVDFTSSKSGACSPLGVLESANKAAADVEMDGAGELIAPDYDLDATPPISHNEVEARVQVEDIDRDRAVGDRSSSKATSTTVPQEKLSDGEGARKGQVTAASGKARSTRGGLSLKKGRKRLSDSAAKDGNSSDAQGPVVKRPKVEGADLNVSDNKPCGTVSTDTGVKPGAEGVDTDVERDMPREENVDSAAVSLTDIKTSKVITMNGENTKSEQTAESSSTTEETKKFTKREGVKGANFVTKMTELERNDEANLLYPNKNQESNKATKVRALPTKVSDDSNGGYTVKRKASGWPTVKVKASEIPRVPSLQAPPGILCTKHTQVLIQCFNEYITKLAMAQSEVLWRLKWGQPVLSVNKVATNTLSAGRTTRRSRTTNEPYSQYALDLKSLSPSPKRHSSSVAAWKRSSSRTPDLEIREGLTPSDSDSDFQPPKSAEKRKTHQKHLGSSTGCKRLNFDRGAVDTSESTPSKAPKGAVSDLRQSKKSAQVGEESKSPFVRVEREESPDILPSRQPTRKSELDFISVSMHSASPPTQSPGRAPQFRDDDVMMLDLTSPTPPCPPSGQRGVEGTGVDIEYGNKVKSIVQSSRPRIGDVTDDSDNEQGAPRPRSMTGTATSHSRIGHDVDQHTNEEGLPPRSRTITGTKSFLSSFVQSRGDSTNARGSLPAATSISTSHSRVSLDTDDSSDERGRSSRTTVGTLSSRSRVDLDTDDSSNERDPDLAASTGTWLDARKPPPQQTKSKRATRKTNNTSKSSARSNKKTTSRGGARGKRTTKKPIAAALRMKALIQKSDSGSEHNSQEDEQEVTRSKGAASKSKPPQKGRKAGRQTLDSSDSDFTDMEFGDQGGGEEGAGGSGGRHTSPLSGHVSEVCGVDKRSNQGSHTSGRVIDLTANSQLPCDHTSQSVPSSRSESPDDNGRVSCPMCGQRFPSSVIQLHAEQCEGPEPDRSHRRGEDITHYATTSVAKSNRGLSMQRRGRRGRKSYQPSLIQLVNKDSAMTREDDIDSNSTSDEPEDDQNDPDAHFDDFTAEDFNTREFEYDHDRLEWTEEDHAQLGEDGEGGYIREPSVDSEVQAEALPIEDGAGGYIIDPSMVSSSPIRSFKRLSDLDPQERAGFDNQFKSKRARGRRNQRGTQQMTGKERHSTTWGRDDFDDLFESGQTGRGGGWRGGYKGRRPFKYDWSRRGAHSRGRSRSRGRRS